MKHLILEIDETTEKRINNAVKIAGLSSQQWLKHIIDEKTIPTWSDSIKALAGAWQDFPLAQELREGEGLDSLRDF